MDIRCATCKEPWDFYHVRHDAPWECVAGWDENLDRAMKRLPADLDAKLHPEIWTAAGLKAGSTVRDLYSVDGWTLGASFAVILRCPCCGENEQHNGPDKHAEARREIVAELGDLLGDDADGAAAMLEDFDAEIDRIAGTEG